MKALILASLTFFSIAGFAGVQEDYGFDRLARGSDSLTIQQNAIVNLGFYLKQNEEKSIGSCTISNVQTSRDLAPNFQPGYLSPQTIYKVSFLLRTQKGQVTITLSSKDNLSKFLNPIAGTDSFDISSTVGALEVLVNRKSSEVLQFHLNDVSCK